MKYRWIFYFDKDHLPIEINDAEYDKKLHESIKNFQPFSPITDSLGKDFFLNMSLVKMISREIIDTDERMIDASGIVESA